MAYILKLKSTTNNTSTHTNYSTPIRGKIVFKNNSNHSF